MTELNAAEVAKLIMADVNEPEDESWDFWPNAGLSDDFTVREIPGIGQIEVIDVQNWHTEVAGEYQGDYTEWKVWVVFRIPDGRTFRLNGVTSSWDSEGFTDVEEVEQVEKLVTVWEKKYDY